MVMRFYLKGVYASGTAHLEIYEVSFAPVFDESHCTPISFWFILLSMCLNFSS